MHLHNFYFQGCRDLNIPFYLLLGEASQVLPKFIEDNKIGGVVTDFNPLRESRKWVEDLKKVLPEDVPFCQVINSSFLLNK